MTFDLGATTLKGGLFNTSSNLIFEANRSSRNVNSVDELVDIIEDLAQEMLECQNQDKNNVIGLGIGVPGFVPLKGDRIPQLVNMGLENVPLKFKLEQKFNAHVLVENDANAAAWGEHKAGASQGTRDNLLITLGTGVGSGVIVNEAIHRGNLGLTGEIGHILVRPIDGKLCNCGKVGCLETECSGVAIESKAKALYDEHQLTAREVFNRADNGDETAKRVIQEASYYLAWGISHALHVLEFEVVVLGGGISRGGNLLLQPVRAYLEDFMGDCPEFPTEKVLVSKLGNKVALHGLYYLIYEKIN
nr:ROK family protein [Natranaerobius thermophilus]